MRQSKKTVDAFYRQDHEFGSKKHVQQFLTQFRQAHAGITLFEYQKPLRHPWHFHHTFFYLEPKVIEEDGFGRLLMLHQTTLDSKKLVKNDLSDILNVNVTRDLLIHQHFFTRLIQRASLDGLREALLVVAHSLAEILNHIKFQTVQFEPGQSIHIVFDNKVFIATCETDKAVLIFKTVILEAFMTDRQQQFYQAAIAAARQRKNGFVMAIEMDEILSLIPDN